jgi:hypothetical protein
LLTFLLEPQSAQSPAPPVTSSSTVNRKSPNHALQRIVAMFVALFPPRPALCASGVRRKRVRAGSPPRPALRASGVGRKRVRAGSPPRPALSAAGVEAKRGRVGSAPGVCKCSQHLPFSPVRPAATFPPSATSAPFAPLPFSACRRLVPAGSHTGDLSLRSSQPVLRPPNQPTTDRLTTLTAMPPPPAAFARTVCAAPRGR